MGFTHAAYYNIDKFVSLCFCVCVCVFFFFFVRVREREREIYVNISRPINAMFDNYYNSRCSTCRNSTPVYKYLRQEYLHNFSSLQACR